jgi:hypothetical protein
MRTRGVLAPFFALVPLMALSAPPAIAQFTEKPADESPEYDARVRVKDQDYAYVLRGAVWTFPPDRDKVVFVCWRTRRRRTRRPATGFATPWPRPGSANRRSPFVGGAVRPG